MLISPEPLAATIKQEDKKLDLYRRKPTTRKPEQSDQHVISSYVFLRRSLAVEDCSLTLPVGLRPSVVVYLLWK